MRSQSFDNKEWGFWEELKEWNLNDIDICLASKANYGATKIMLSFIDILGGFHGGLIKHKEKLYVRAGGNQRSLSAKTMNINGREYEESGSKKEFKNFVKSYINEFNKTKIKVKTKTKNKNKIIIKTTTKSWLGTDVLYDHFRCGLIHEGHSKFGTGIVKLNEKEIIKINFGGVPVVLNILYLRDLVRRAVFEFDDDVFVKQKKERVARWKDRFEYLTSEHKL